MVLKYIRGIDPVDSKFVGTKAVFGKTEAKQMLKLTTGILVKDLIKNLKGLNNVPQEI